MTPTHCPELTMHFLTVLLENRFWSQVKSEPEQSEARFIPGDAHSTDRVRVISEGEGGGPRV